MSSGAEPGGSDIWAFHGCFGSNMTLCNREKSGIYDRPKILFCGDTGISIEFGNEIDAEINRRVRRLYRALRSAPHPGILDINPTYCSLFIQYDPWVCSLEKLISIVEGLFGAEDAGAPESEQIIQIPVCYETEYGLDVEDVAKFHGISTEQVIEIHTTPVYHVFMIGFVLGFPYLGGLDERLYTPRKKDPRKVVPAGSVAIGDRQTGIYPVESPGGWHIVGRTPLKIFDLERKEPFLLAMGDGVKFKPITRDEFNAHIV